VGVNEEPITELATVAVNVTAAPKGAGLGDAVSVVAVAAAIKLALIVPQFEGESVGEPP
jgi:hypothetical protein